MMTGDKKETMMATTRVPPYKAKAALNAIRRQFKSWIGPGERGPVLLEYEDGTQVISWEEGPYEWVFFAFDGGVEQEFGFPIEPVKRPTHVFTEPMNHYALALYRD